MEQEALGLKEGLVKFQAIIEGEKVICITHHAALQWAQTYENTNRRLALWGAIYMLYPGLEIVYRAGKVHSNVDVLSRLVRTLMHQSPISDDSHMIKGVLPQNPLTTWEELMERVPAQMVALVNSKTKRSQETHQEEDNVWTEQELQVERRRREHSGNPPGPEGQHEGLQLTISSAKLKLYMEGYEEDPSM